MKEAFQRTVGWVILAGCACLTVAGCEQPVLKTLVTGTVTIDGEPIETGMIAFEPDDPAAPSATAEIHDGQFSINSPRGTRRVSIMAYREASGKGPDGGPYQEQFLPPKYNVNSDRFIEVDATPLADQNFEITLSEDESK